ncbi:MAG: DUF4861 family protein [Candidatus Marinimicrobia bacterium]|nr:DUF4861 family protein [Candidatus Neomarinimicrobiota bacterium]
MKKLLFVILISGTFFCSQTDNKSNKTDISLFMRADSTIYLSEVNSESGDLYTSIGHHGPAVENDWMGLRIYFSEKTAIDVYNKSKPGLELKQARWYPTVEQQKTGWGADYYKVSKTVGLGGVRLWDGSKVVFLNPVTNRTARVVKEKTSSYMEMLSEGVPYKDRTVDILVRVTVFSGVREAKVEAFALTDLPVQFVTGINYHKGEEVQNNDGLIATWGIHPEDVAAELINIGAAIIYEPSDFVDKQDDGTQILLISKPCKQLTTWISSASEREKELNTMGKFLQSLNIVKYINKN